MTHRAGKMIASTLDVLAIIATITVAALTALLVVARFAAIPVVGLYEIITLAAMMMYMVGAVISSRNRSHLAVDYWSEARLGAPVPGFASPRLGITGALHRLLVAVITTAITLFFIYWTYKMFMWGAQRPQWTPAYGIPLWLPQASLIIGAVGCFLYALGDVLKALIELRSFAREEAA